MVQAAGGSDSVSVSGQKSTISTTTSYSKQPSKSEDKGEQSAWEMNAERLKAMLEKQKKMLLAKVHQEDFERKQKGGGGVAISKM